MSKADELLLFLQETFGQGVGAISRAQFRLFLGISASTDSRLFVSNRYPKCIGGRILLPDLAAWLSEASSMPDSFIRRLPRKRGRPPLFNTELLEGD